MRGEEKEGGLEGVRGVGIRSGMLGRSGKKVVECEVLVVGRLIWVGIVMEYIDGMGWFGFLGEVKRG